MRRLLFIGAGFAVLLLLAAFILREPSLRHEVKQALGLEPRPQLTPLAIGSLPPTRALPTTTVLPPSPSPVLQGTATPMVGTSTPQPTATAVPTSPPTVSPTPAPVSVNGRLYDAYIPAAVKAGQAYQYSCEFDAAWVILQTFGIDADVDTIIERTPRDPSVEPSYAETSDGFVIYGGDIRSAFSGDYTQSFLARSSGGAFVPVFASFGLEATPVNDRAGVEAALRQGALVWMKTTVDFKPWRPATWITPDGSRVQTVLGNDHAVVVIGYNSDVVVIRDVLGPTSTNRQRSLEYEVTWDVFLWAWEAQAFDGLAVAPPGAS